MRQRRFLLAWTTTPASGARIVQKLELLPEMSEAILLDFEPVRLNAVVDRRGLDLTAQRLDLLGDCELAEELEFALGFPEIMPDPGIGLSLREQLAAKDIL